MGDLDFTKASQVVSITGSDASGLETNMVKASANQDLGVADIFDNGGLNGSITVGLTEVEAKVGVSALSNRKGINIFHNGSGKLYWGFTGVSTSNGTQIFKNTSTFIPAGPNSHIYLISDSTGQDIRIVEVA